MVCDLKGVVFLHAIWPCRSGITVLSHAFMRWSSNQCKSQRVIVLLIGEVLWLALGNTYCSIEHTNMLDPSWLNIVTCYFLSFTYQWNCFEVHSIIVISEAIWFRKPDILIIYPLLFLSERGMLVRTPGDHEMALGDCLHAPVQGFNITSK